MLTDTFEPFNPATLAAPHAFWEALRREAPVYKLNVPGVSRPFYMITRRADVQHVAADTETFSSIVPSEVWRWGDLGPELQPVLLESGWPIVHTIASADPPAHAKYRRIVGAIFAPSKVRTLAPKIQGSIDDLVDALPVGQPFDFMTRFAVPLPITMIADLLGMPKSEHGLIVRYTDSFVTMVDPSTDLEAAKAAVRVFAEGQRHLAQYLDRYRREPADTPFSVIANARDGDGQALTIEEQLSLCYLLMAAGNETTRNALALAAHQLAISPDLWAELRAQPDKVAVFVEEILRVGTPAVVNPRYVTREVDLAGVSLPRGAVVFMMWGAANRDESTYPAADEIRLNRPKPRDHLAFGYGIHNCVGSVLARLELTLSIASWLRRFDSLSLAVAREQVQFAPLFGFRTFRELPLRLTPAVH